MLAVGIKKYIVTLVFIIIIMINGFYGVIFASSGFGSKTAFNTTNLIRLHIMANSDGLDDQLLKTAIRDTVLMEVKGFLEEVTVKSGVWQMLSENLNKIEAAAREKIYASNKDYDVKVELGTFSFPACNYGNLQVPAGDYDAIRIILGEGTGQNWWCVLFPPLCFIEIENSGRILGLEVNMPPGEALLKLNIPMFDLNYKPSVNNLQDYKNVLVIPVTKTAITDSTCLFLTLNNLL